VDARSDLYSAGCLLYELLTGRTPFVGDSPVSIAYQHVGQAPEPPSVYKPGLSADLDAVVLHALVKDRDARYQDATAFRSDLAAARSGRPISSAALGTAAAAAALGAAGLAGATTAMAQTDPTQVVGGMQHNTASLPAIGKDPDEVPTKPHKTTYALLAVAVIAALVLLGLAGKALFGGDPAAGKVSVPAVITLTQGQAEVKLRSVGFVPLARMATSTKEKGTVTDQNPQAGERYPAKTIVTITVSSGPGEATVPNLAGFTVDSATAALKNVGLTVGAVDQVDDPKVDKGKVIETDPKADASVPAGSAVTLKVASGKVKVPDVVGAARGDAQQTLTDARLKYTTKFADSNQPEGTVLAETQAGQTVEVGTQIVLTVAQKPQPTPTPGPTTGPPTPTASTPPAATTAP
jgi:serine/threonine-protein kinase